jgi:hypothetical protein
MKTAADLKKGDTFRKQGFKFTVDSVTNEEYKNGKASILVACSTNDSKVVDSFFHFKPATKIK